MKNQTLDKIYQKHHTERRRGGFAVLEKERGGLFAKLIGKNKKILDLGCRDGVITKYFSSGNDVLGVDVDSEIIKKAHSDLGIDVISLDIQQDWPFEEGVFDVIVAGEVLEHVFLPEEVIKKIVMVLKPDGVFIGSVPNAFSLKNRLRYLLGKKKGTPLGDPMHINQFSLVELRSVLEKHFSKVEIYPLGNSNFGLSRIFTSLFAYSMAFVANQPMRDPPLLEVG